MDSTPIPQKRILVVDDEPRNVALLTGLLESFGYDFVTASNAYEALEKIDSSIDAALLDVLMPGMNGFELCGRIRQDPNYHDLPIVMATVLDSKEDRIKAVEAGANDFVSKPVDRLELRVRMASVLRIKEAQDHIKRHANELEVFVEKRTAELRRSEELFRTVFEAAGDCIFVKDTSFRYSHVNPAMLRLMNLPAESVLGRNDSEIFGKGLSESTKAQEARVLRGQVLESEHTVSWLGIKRILSLIRFPLNNGVGQIVGICGIARDVTDLRRLSNEPYSVASRYVSEAMRKTLEETRLAAKADSIVLLLGENGSGKDYIARYLHDNSLRSTGSFFNINCAALSAELAESELFGHESGAFTGARTRKRGLVELAEGGTLLLNEVGELTPQLQAKLLTFLDSKSFTRVGGEKMLTVDVRIVAATNRDLYADVATGKFRRDLFYRLNVFTIQVPPLRDRTGDMPILVNDLLVQLAEKMGLARIPPIDPDVMQGLETYNWPGNVRELRNILERALILSGGDPITNRHVSLIDSQHHIPDSHNGTLVPLNDQTIGSMPEVLEHIKRELIEKALSQSRGSVTVAASNLGITRESLKHHMRSLGIKPEK
jgi:PAS domain S-box-containing protein